MYKHIENVAEAIEHIRFMEKKLWGGRLPNWRVQEPQGQKHEAHSFLHVADIELKNKDRLLGWINFGWMVNIDWNADEPRAQHDFTVTFKQSDGRMALIDHLELGLRYFIFKRKVDLHTEFNPEFMQSVHKWRTLLNAFAHAAAWAITNAEYREYQYSGACSPQDDQRFARFLSDTLFDDLGNVPRSTGV
jgi:hypothetical protein